ncbi:MAG: YbaN family protein [Nitrosospira sp.]|nr:YbaN family protein [Nitrosospira sp.]MDN5882869.1 YbaN family protein [Nitrosospira sp.]
MQERLNEEIQERHEADSTEANSARPHGSRVMRALYLTVGFAALILGVVGIVVPVLPTTPFVLLAAACFARSSKRFHDKLLANPIAGPIIREWIEHRSIPRRVKRWVYLLMALSFGGSILLMPSALYQVMLAVLGVILVAFIWRIPVRDIDTSA